METSAKQSNSKKHAGEILRRPRITEKAAMMVEVRGAYVFEVAIDANKKEIADAVRTLFKVTPMKVRTVITSGKRALTRGTNRMGTQTAKKKAYVYLKKGETIETV